MMRDYLDYVRTIEDAMRQAASIAAPRETSRPAMARDSKAAPVLMLSPHPDDEMLVGGLPLRFMRQCGMRVVNVSVTLGSKKERQMERLAELRAACASIGFETLTVGERGLGGITPDAPRDTPVWSAAVDAVAAIIADVQPSAVFFPHELDGNRTHMGVHVLAMDALERAGHACHVFETEFWAAMGRPNLMVESTPEDVAALITALGRHVGEVSRNPYHLRMPAWMMDNVRRGAEIVGGQGGNVPNYTFATLYRHSFWNTEGMEYFPGANLFLSASESVAALLDYKN